MRAVVLGFLAALWGGAAMAADEPQYGPPPGWVKEADLPAPKRDTGVTEFLLNDAEVKAQPEGIQIYSRLAFKILSPEALTAAGNLTFAWRPDTSELTINHVRIVRDGKVIDLLAGGEKPTVIRREQNLERAVIDGVLTAVFQPAGLQVGDIVDFASTTNIHDPAVRGHIEEFTSNMTAAGPDQLRVRMLWPTSAHIRWRAGEGLAPPKITKGRDETELLVDMRDVQPVKVPERAPPRFSDVADIEMTDFSSWKEASALMAPLYREASELGPDSPLKAEVAKIRAQSSDPKVQAAAALRLVQDQVRYVALVLNDGGYVPAKADETWTRRFGDCKAKSVLLVALLKELGIEAEPALASVTRNDGLASRLPLLSAFDHVIVRAVIGGKVYWLDGARIGDRDLDEQPASAYRWALPVRVEGADLEALPAHVDKAPLVITTLDFDASGGLDAPAPVKGEVLMRGDAAKLLTTVFNNLPPSERADALRKFWKDDYDWIDVKNADLHSDDAKGELRFTMDGVAKMDWSSAGGKFRRYETDGSSLGWKSNMKRDGGPHQDAPFAVTYPYYPETIETIVLPNKGVGFSFTGKDVDRTVGAWKFHRKAAIADGVFRLEASTQAIASEIPAADALASAAPLKALYDDDVYIIAPESYRPTDQEMAALAKSTPDTADAYVERANVRLERGENDQAIADLNEALKLNPKDALAYADRGVGEYWKGDYAAAAADAAKALSIDSQQWVAYNVQGLLAEHDHQPQKAIEAYTRSYDVGPTNFILLRRGQLYLQLNDFEHALADADAALRNYDHQPEALELRASVLQAQGKYAEALDAADKYVAVAPDAPNSHLARGNALLMLRRRDEAAQEFDAALKIHPSAGAYIGRAQTAYGPEQIDRAIADVDEALKLEPDMFEARLLHANMLIRSGKAAQAVDDTEKLIAQKPDDLTVIEQRVAALVAVHRDAEALEVIAKVPADQIDNPGQLNQRCWTRATLNKDLDLALVDCNAALKLKPDSAAALDSRGFTHVRLGQYDAAIADYGAALKLNPKQADSYFGRALAELKKGERSEALTDLATARGLDKSVDARFASFGVKPDEAPPPS